MDSNLTQTENGAVAYKSTNDAPLDFFVKTNRNTPIETLFTMFDASWNQDPMMTLKIVMNLRDIRGGKGEKRLGIILIAMLSRCLPDTYKGNFDTFLNLGCMKDLLKIAELKCHLDDVWADNSCELNYFATQLKKDYALISCPDATPNQSISLAGKWAPGERTHYDHTPLKFATKLSKEMSLNRKQYRLMLKSLRSHLNVLETNMCQDTWDKIDFKSIPAAAHRLNRRALSRKTNADEVESESRSRTALRYGEYMSKLIKGETTIKSTGTQPHDLISGYLEGSESDPILDAQFNDIIDKLRSVGSFQSSCCIVDVSGSMYGVPLQVAIALGLIVSELCTGEFHDKLITFSADPKLLQVQGDCLRDRVHSVKSMEWGMNTNLEKVFNLILTNAIATHVQPEDMIQTLFIFTDMQFDQSQSNTKSSFMDDMRAKYMSHDYPMPKIVFWNLRGDTDNVPSQMDENGTALVSGFSTELLKVFLSGADNFTPHKIMELVLTPYTPIIAEHDVGYIMNTSELSAQVVHAMDKMVIKSGKNIVKSADTLDSSEEESDDDRL
jgi:hypothetical protein